MPSTHEVGVFHVERAKRIVDSFPERQAVSAGHKSTQNCLASTMESDILCGRRFLHVLLLAQGKTPTALPLVWLLCAGGLLPASTRSAPRQLRQVTSLFRKLISLLQRGSFIDRGCHCMNQLWRQLLSSTHCPNVFDVPLSPGDPPHRGGVPTRGSRGERRSGGNHRLLTKATNRKPAVSANSTR